MDMQAYYCYLIYNYLVKLRGVYRCEYLLRTNYFSRKINWKNIIGGIVYMTNKILISLVAIYCITGEWTTSQSLSDRPVAVSIEELKAYGVVTRGRNGCDDSTLVSVYSDSELTIKVDSIACHSFIKYDRLSELNNKPYWAPRAEHALSGGEKFKIYNDSIIGWIDDEELMTFSSAWRERNTERFFAIDQNNVVIVHSSGQFESAGCAILSLWERQFPQNNWHLLANVLNPIQVGLYVFPIIDGIKRYDKDNIAIQMSAFGGDAGDIWGTFAFYLYHENELTLAFSRQHNYNCTQNYTKIEYELSLDEVGDPVALMIQKHFVIDDSNSISYSSVLVATDTTVVKLLN